MCIRWRNQELVGVACCVHVEGTVSAHEEKSRLCAAFEDPVGLGNAKRDAMGKKGGGGECEANPGLMSCQSVRKNELAERWGARAVTQGPR